MEELSIAFKNNKLNQWGFFSTISATIFDYLCRNAFVSGAGGLRLKSLAGQIEHSIVNGSPPLRHFFETNGVAGGNDVEMGLANPLHASG